LRSGADFRAAPIFAARLLNGRFLTLPEFALRIVARSLFSFRIYQYFQNLTIDKGKQTKW